MNEADLIEFNSPPLLPKVNPNTEICSSSSPGSNPFDTLTKFTEDLNQFQEVAKCVDNLFDLSNSKEFLDCGRESLGILKLDALNTSFPFNNGSELISPLNMGFLCSNSNDLETISLQLFGVSRKQPLSSISSATSLNPSSFNSASLEEPSKIYSLGSSLSYCNFSLSSVSPENLNNAFLSSNSAPKQQRLLSLPECLSKFDKSTVCSDKEEKRVLYNDSKAISLQEESPKSQEISNSDDNLFNDSVFIEANYLASKIADGSILLENSIEENMLDNTNPPEFEELAESSPNTKPNMVTVFKFIDKILPPVQDQQEKSKDTTEDQPTERSSSISKSKNANDILKNLSKILDNECKDSRQNNEGHKLLNSLASILSSCDSAAVGGSSLEDSGHSSIEPEEQVLDLRVTHISNDEKQCEGEQALDLSIKSARNVKSLSQSLSFPKPKLPAIKLFNSQTTSMGAISNKDKSKSKSDSGRLSYKKSKSEILRKGPLKAVIPLGNMSKCSDLASNSTSNVQTPVKGSVRKLDLFKMKRTSTPITGPVLKPIAQSTPDEMHGTDKKRTEKKRISHFTNSKVKLNGSSIRPKSSCDNFSMKSNKGNRCGSTPNLTNCSVGAKTRESFIPSPKNMLRRHSASDLKRDHYTGKDLKSGSGVISKIKQNVLSALSKEPARSNNNALRQMDSSNIKSVNVTGKLKKSRSNKENVTR